MRTTQHTREQLDDAGAYARAQTADDLDLASEIKRHANVAARHLTYAEQETDQDSRAARDWRYASRRHETFLHAFVDEARRRLGTAQHADLDRYLDLYGARHLVDQTGIELEASTWPRYTLDGRKMTQTAARKALAPYGERIRWAHNSDHLDADDVADARWVAEELEPDGTPWSWTYRGHDRAELESAVVTWALVNADEDRGTYLRITDRLA